MKRQAYLSFFDLGLIRALFERFKSKGERRTASEDAMFGHLCVMLRTCSIMIFEFLFRFDGN